MAIKPHTQWTEREKRDHDEMAKVNNYYDRKLVVSHALPSGEITVFPAVSTGMGLLHSIDGPMVPLSIADAQELINSLQAALAARVNYLEQHP